MEGGLPPVPVDVLHDRATLLAVCEERVPWT